jgi:hypothetical protein
MRHLAIVSLATLGIAMTGSTKTYDDRLVWIFGWSLRKDDDVRDIAEILETASKRGFNGVVLSAGLDRLSKQPPDYFQRLEQIKTLCKEKNLELIPAIFSVGYGGGVLAHDRNLAEGLPVRNASFIVEDSEARLTSDSPVQILNGDFETFSGVQLNSFNFHDMPGEVSFPDTEVVHNGKASLRFENFAAHPANNARVMQEIEVRPRRCYRASLWVKTEGLRPANNFRLLALAGERDLAPREFGVPSTTDWRKVTMLFNSLDFDRARLYAGVWGGREGKFWVDDWTIEEVGPINVLRRPGTPVTVTNEDGTVTYQEGTDYAPLVDENFTFWNVDRESPSLHILPDSRIQDGRRLRVSWHHPMVINDSQVTVCMGEPALYDIFTQEAKLLWEHLQPRRVLLNMDEVRAGGSCQACGGRNMAELLGECVTRQVNILRQLNPDMEIGVWSDMLDPNHNARNNYYLVEGDFTGTWNHVPKDLIISVWGGAPRPESLRFFAENGFQTWVACYYDADDLTHVEGWQGLAEQTPGVRGFMYTTWLKKYGLLGEFGDLLVKD